MRKMAVLLAFLWGAFSFLFSPAFAQVDVDSARFIASLTKDTVQTTVTKYVTTNGGIKTVIRYPGGNLSAPEVVEPFQGIPAGITYDTMISFPLLLDSFYLYKYLLIDSVNTSLRDSVMLGDTTRGGVKLSANIIMSDLDTAAGTFKLSAGFLDHGSVVSLALYEIGVSAPIDLHLSLSDAGYFGTDTFYRSQPVGTTKQYTIGGWNAGYPGDLDYTDTITVTIPSIVHSGPDADSISLSSVSTDSIQVYVHWDHNLVATGYFHVGCNGGPVTSFVAFIPITAGPGDTLIWIPHSCGSSSSVTVQFLIQDAAGQDSIRTTANTPVGPMASLVPHVVSINPPTSATIAVDSVSTVDSVWVFQMEAIDHADTTGGSIAFFRQGWNKLHDTTFANIFHGTYAHCYDFRTVVIDGNNTRRSWFYQFMPSLCFGTTSIVEPDAAGWHGVNKDLTVASFPNWIEFRNILGQTVMEDVYCDSWEEMMRAISQCGNIVSGSVVMVSTRIHPVTQARRKAKVLKM